MINIIKFVLSFSLVLSLAFILSYCGQEKLGDPESLTPEPTLTYLYEKSFNKCAGCHYQGGTESAGIALVDKKDFLDLVGKQVTVEAEYRSAYSDNFFINTNSPNQSLIVLTVTTHGNGLETSYQTHATNNSALDSKDTEMLLQWIQNGAKDD